MIFQTLDDKDECVGFYYDGQLHFDAPTLPDDLTQTWKYASYLDGHDGIEYANLYLEGRSLEDVLPEYLLDDWKEESGRLRSFMRSLSIAQVDRNENCTYDLLPSRFLKDYCQVKNRLTEHVLTHCARPRRYKYYLALCKMLTAIAQRRLNVDTRRLQTYLSSPSTRSLVERLVGKSYIKYNQFGTITGRLTTHPGSFPLLTLRKDLRTVVLPTNDVFVELDFNGAEARVMLGLLGLEQPRVDIHKYHQQSVFGGVVDREKAKSLFFAWLYGSRAAAASAEGKVLETFYHKEQILDKYWDGKNVHTPYRKEISGVDEHHALNYIVQSTTAELSLLQSLKIHELLKSSSSHVACIIHDAVVLDMCQQDMHLLEPIKKLMSSTKFGQFGINISTGKNLGHLTKKESYAYG